MKKWLLVPALLVLLSGCGGESTDMERALALRSDILRGESCNFDAEITADYGEKIHRFSMTCQGDKDGNLRFTVMEPQTIAGISGHLEADGGKLLFEDTALQFDLLADDQLSPVAAPWVLLRTLRSGYIRSAGTEDGNLLVTMDDSFEEDALQVDLWLDPQNVPIRGEILYDGKRILSLRVKNFRLL